MSVFIVLQKMEKNIQHMHCSRQGNAEKYTYLILTGKDWVVFTSRRGNS